MIKNEEWHGHIDAAIKNCQKQAKKAKDVVEFDFNGVTVRVAGDSDAKLIYRDWDRGMNGYLGEKPTVGPYPSVMLSEDEIRSDTRIEVANEQRREVADRKYAEEQRQKEGILKGALAVAAPIELKDEAAWKNTLEINRDHPYSNAVSRYAENWARLMQGRIRDGASVADVADECSHVADAEGITGFMYGCAVSILSKCWKHGEELRRWHNKTTQLGTEGDKANEDGGVLNPALLRIG